MTVIPFIVIANGPAPIAWKITHAPEKEPVFFHRAKASRTLSSQETRKMADFCKMNIGEGGRIPLSPERRWFFNERGDEFHFKTESDMLLFVVAFSG